MGNAHMRHIEPLDRSDKTDDIALLDTPSATLDLLFRQIIIAPCANRLLLCGDPGRQLRLPFQLLITVRMGRDKVECQRQRLSAYRLIHIFHNPFLLVHIEPIGHIMQSVGIIVDLALTVTNQSQLVAKGIERGLVQSCSAAQGQRRLHKGRTIQFPEIDHQAFRFLLQRRGDIRLIQEKKGGPCHQLIHRQRGSLLFYRGHIFLKQPPVFRLTVTPFRRLRMGSRHQSQQTAHGEEPSDTKFSHLVTRF